MDYLFLFALLCMAYGWAMLAKTAAAKKDEDAGDSFFHNKLVTGQYFLDRILPDAKAHLAKVKAGAGSVMALPEEAF
jgi:hypothetical protein